MYPIFTAAGVVPCLPVHYLIIVQIIYLIIFSEHWDHSESVHKYSPAEAGARGCGQSENFTVLNLNHLNQVCYFSFFDAVLGSRGPSFRTDLSDSRHFRSS